MESSASLELAKHSLLMFGAILAVGTFSGLIARLAKVPDVVVFLLFGLMIGPSMLGFVDIKADSTINQLIMIFGSSFILFDGGASVRLKVLKEVWITILVLATAGVLITAAITGLAAHYFLGLAPMLRCCSERLLHLPTPPHWFPFSNRYTSRIVWRRP
jgi:cell volume regulation protein A